MADDDSELEGAGVLADQSWRRRNPSLVAGAEIHFSHDEAVDWTTGSCEAIFRHVDQANSQKMRPKPGSAVYQICIAKAGFIVYICPAEVSLLFPDKSLLTLLPQIVSSRSLVSIVRHLETVYTADRIRLLRTRGHEQGKFSRPRREAKSLDWT